MDYKQLLEKAIQLACNKHDGQADKGNDPYILHPLRVMFSARKEYEFWRGRDEFWIISIVAVLHDIIEDTDVTLQELTKLGFTAPVVDTIHLLTKKETDEYSAYINRIADSKNKIGMIVKIADLRDNQDCSRLVKPLSEEDFARIRKYKKAEEVISTVLNNTTILYPVENQAGFKQIER